MKKTDEAAALRESLRLYRSTIRKELGLKHTPYGLRDIVEAIRKLKADSAIVDESTRVVAETSEAAAFAVEHERARTATGFSSTITELDELIRRLTELREHFERFAGGLDRTATLPLRSSQWEPHR